MLGERYPQPSACLPYDGQGLCTLPRVGRGHHNEIVKVMEDVADSLVPEVPLQAIS